MISLIFLSASDLVVLTSYKVCSSYVYAKYYQDGVKHFTQL